MRRIAGVFGTWAVAITLAGSSGPAQTVVDANKPAEPAPLGVEAVKAPPPPIEVPPTGDDPEDARKLDALLERWEGRSATVKSLDAAFRRVDRKVGLRTLAEYEGRILLEGSRLACLNLEKVVPNPDPQARINRLFHERLICTGEEVVWYDGASKSIGVFPAAGGEDQREFRPWPAPFLFGVKAVELKGRYEIRLVQEGRDATRIEFTPRLPGGGGARNLWDQLADFFAGKPPGVGFSRAILDLDRETFLPRALMLTSPDKDETLTYVFKAIAVNPTIAAENFQRKAIEGWTVVRAPRPEGRRNVAARPREGAGEADAKGQSRPR